MWESSKEIIYTPESELRHPLRLVKDMWADLKISRELAWRLTLRDISALYRQTALGYFWAILPPLVTSLVFIILNSSKVIDIGNINVPYPVYVITGTVFWQLFVDAVNAPLKVMTVNRAMLSKINFPRESLILAGIGQVLFSFMVKIVLLTATLLLFKASVQWTAIFVVFPALGLLGLGTLIGVFLVPIGVLYKDVQQGLAIAISALMFLTPVVYPPPQTETLAGIMKFNPLTPLLQLTRDFLFTGTLNYLGSFAAVFFGNFCLLFFGWILYRIALPILIERMVA